MTILVLLLASVVGAWLALAVAYLVLEPAERTVSGLLLPGVLVAMLIFLTLVVRKSSGTPGLVALISVVLPGTLATGWVIL